ncbi:MAG: hypothetical protein COU11_01090 [Candidatus Harrisonbacteria bacterium CG10_big_fil_rev_8_21_14_0_10_49_15]|uniref:Cell shape-determining protein MreC n=1 Tax=Candidatus Harrisonbacteria bacterium CG10_big_fil_rev_8_21_14_0_10_49_15 TaxID=1974587 RepID=A0A2H0ULR4_9BACT|nr:MAG: hypothetical protein COU11_01090 [Candidatus Harrisonbacteria bacterium CG10_big_fil_rev_8_21_14_0_10_49_15]
MSKNSKRTKVVLGVLALLLLLGQWLFVPRTYVRSRLGQALQAPFVFLESLRSRSALVDQLKELQIENLGLRAELASVNARPELIQEEGQRYVRARAYSSYPLNNVDNLLINVGENVGVEVGMPVLVTPNLFFGEVVEVFETMAMVRTIFDPGWELQVKIGDQNADSLFVGGPSPRLTLISKGRRVASDQEVYLTDKRYPLGLVLGAVGQISDSDQNLFEEASLDTPYTRSDINQLYVRL